MIIKSKADYDQNAPIRLENKKRYKQCQKTVRKYQVQQNFISPGAHRVLYSEYLKAFREIAKEGPDFICTCCRRTLFRDQIVACSPDIYVEKKGLTKADKARLLSYISAPSRPETGWICDFNAYIHNAVFPVHF